MPAPEAGPGTSRPALNPVRPHRRWRRWWLWPLAIWLGFAAWHTQKPLPAGVRVASEPVAVQADALRFLADVTATDRDGRPVRQQSIHAAVLELVRGAQDFLLLDYFLFNDQGGPAGPLRYDNGLAPVSAELIQALTALKRAQPDLPVLVITDPINDYYRGTPPPRLAALEALGIDVVVTRLGPLRDSNPLYSATWRMLLAWWLPRRGEGGFDNVLDAAGPDLPPGALLTLPNFKANHRKVVLTGDGAGSLVGIVSSANPHDASSAHSNVALRMEGEVLRPLLASELAIARYSGWPGGALAGFAQPAERAGPAAEASASIITEGAIREALLTRLAATRAGDAIDIAMFYFSDRPVIEALLAAARRGVAVRLLLDSNRDAFGFEKGGIPNRPMANCLLRDADGGFQLRWYLTHGEQFHSKLVAVRGGDRLWFTLGSANLTRRNIGDYNLEANVIVDTPLDSPVAQQVTGWFDTLWSNRDGIEYSAPPSAWQEDSRWRYWRYRVMEASGLSTF